MKLATNQSGLTILEMVIYLTVVSVVSLAFFAFTNNSIGILFSQRSQAETQSQVHQAFRSMNDLIREGVGTTETNDNVADANDGSGWNAQSSHPAVVIIPTYAVDSDNDFIIDLTTFLPYLNDNVFFVSNGVLYRRTLANPLAIGNAAKTSCPAAIASGSCPADAKLASNVKNFEVELINAGGSVVTDPTDASSMRVNLILERKQFGQTTTVDQTTQIVFRNQ